MQSLTPGSHEMNSVSDSSVHHQQTVEAGEPSQHFPHTATIPPFINQGMYCKSSYPHSHHEVVRNISDRRASGLFRQSLIKFLVVTYSLIFLFGILWW